MQSDQSANKSETNNAPTLLRTTQSALRNWQSAWVVLAVGLMITAAAAMYMKSSVESIEDRAFTSQCNDIKNKITGRLDDHARILQSGAALFKASETVTREKWHIFTQTEKVEKQLPGIQGIGFSLLIPREELTRHTQSIRKEGFPEYKLRPDGDRKVYSSIIYLEPFSRRNLRAFGYDMFTEPVRRAAMERARDTDAAALSGKVVLVQETDTDVQAGTLMYVPVYRKGLPIETVEQRRVAIYGWVYSPYRMNDLMQGILGDRNPDNEKQIHTQVFDGAQPSPQSLLYESLPVGAEEFRGQISNLSLKRFTRQIPVDFNGQRWTLIFRQTSGGLSTVAYRSVWITMVGGILITILLFALIRTLLNTSTTARRIANNLTAELRESEGKMQLLLNSAAEAIYGIDMNGNCTFCNNTCLHLLGYKYPEDLLGKNMHWQIHSKYPDGTLFPVAECRIYKAFLDGKGTHVNDEVLWRSDDTSFPAEYWSYPLLRDGLIMGAVVTFFDITARKEIEAVLSRAEDALREKTALLSGLLASIPDIVFFKNMHGVYLGCNPEFCRFVGQDTLSIVGSTDYDLFSKEIAEFFRMQDRIMTDKGVPHRNEEWIEYPDGARTLVDTLKAPLRDADGHVIGLLGVSRDITERKRYQDNLEYFAIHDQLTGLLNRRSLEDMLNRTIAKAKRGIASSLLYMDLDNFKAVNDSAGHSAGDEVLITLAGLLKDAVRTEDVVFRLGGDEFAVLLDGIDGKEALPAAERMRSVVEEHRFEFEGRIFPLTLSIGIKEIDGAVTTGELMSQADIAMYQAKEHGKNRMVLA